MSAWDRFLNLWRSEAVDRETDDELRFHREMRTARNIERGMDPGAADAEARRHLGSTLRAREGVREVRVMTALESLGADVRYGARLLRRRAGLAGLAIATLSLGIGANAAIFTLLNAILLRPMPYEDPDRLVVVVDRFTRLGVRGVPPTIPEIIDLGERNHVLSSIAFFDTRDYRMTGGVEPTRVFTARVSASLFPTLGVRPALGRLFVGTDNLQGHWNVVILSDGLWRRNFGSDVGVVGRTLNLNGAPHTVVGVLPREFSVDYPGISSSEAIEMYVPFQMYEAYTSRTVDFVNVRRVTTIARLAASVTRQQASAALQTIADQIAAEHPELYRRAGADVGYLLDVDGLHDIVSRDARGVLTVLFGAVLLVLVIASVNTGQFLLAQSLDRRHEVAVRVSLGAGRLRLFRQFLVESSLLAALGGTLGLLQSLWLVRALVALLPGHRPELDTMGVDRMVLAFTVAVSVLTALVVGVLPALYFSRANPSDRLGVRGSTGSGQRARQALVGIEVAVAVVLLVAAGLLIQGLRRLQNADRGFSPDHVTVMQIRGTGSQATQPIASTEYQHYLDHIAAMSGVEAAAATTALPLRGSSNAEFVIEGRPRDPADTARQLASYQIVSGDYFRVFHIPLREGRFIANDDVVERPRVAVINETLAHRYWPTESAIGRKLRVGPDTLTIVGVVGDVPGKPVETTPVPQIYVSNLQKYEPNMNLVVRAAPGASITIEAIKKAIWAVSRNQAVFNIQPMTQIVRGSVAEQRWVALLLGGFAALALLMSAAGVYMIVWYLVMTRTREIAVRLAVGARASDIVRLVSRQTLGWTVAGLVVGVAAAIATSGIARTAARGIGEVDPLTIAALVVFYLMVAGAAMLAPIARTLRVIDPATALRAE
jgi:putative ABC transport system permease protein